MEIAIKIIHLNVYIYYDPYIVHFHNFECKYTWVITLKNTFLQQKNVHAFNGCLFVKYMVHVL